MISPLSVCISVGYRCLFFLLLFGGFISLTFGQSTDTSYFYYKGKIDNSYSVTMELLQTNDSWSGQYFYDKYRRAIPLQVELKDTVLYLREVGKGGANGHYFRLNYKKNYPQVKGVWYKDGIGPAYIVDVQKIQFSSKNNRSRFDELIQFQEFLNYFDLIPSVPLQVKALLSSTKINWLEGSSKVSYSNFKQYIPYALAKRYIMNKTTLSVQEGFNYLKIPLRQYNAIDFHYRSLCTLFKTANFISCLIAFENDTGWENYQVVLWLTFDYSGNLLAQSQVFKSNDITSGSKKLKERQEGFFLSDSSLIIRGEQYLEEPKYDTKGAASYRATSQKFQQVYRLSPAGRLLLIESSKDNKPEK